MYRRKKVSFYIFCYNCRCFRSRWCQFLKERKWCLKLDIDLKLSILYTYVILKINPHAFKIKPPRFVDNFKLIIISTKQICLVVIWFGYSLVCTQKDVNDFQLFWSEYRDRIAFWRDWPILSSNFKILLIWFNFKNCL